MSCNNRREAAAINYGAVLLPSPVHFERFTTFLCEDVAVSVYRQDRYIIRPTLADHDALPQSALLHLTPTTHICLGTVQS